MQDKPTNYFFSPGEPKKISRGYKRRASFGLRSLVGYCFEKIVHRVHIDSTILIDDFQVWQKTYI